MPIISRIIKGVGSGIGLASEAIADHKEKKAAQQGLGQTSTNPEVIVSESHARSPSPYLQVPNENKSAQSSDDEESSSSDEEDLGKDHAEWALDEAASKLDDNLPPYSEELESVPPMPVDDVARSFLDHHSVGAMPGPTQSLPQPVILPQRRPKNRSRGFVRGYAPILGEYKGIDQQTFLDFLDDFDKASKASPVFDVINLACFAVGMVPNPIAMGVTIAVQVVNTTAKEVQGRHRTNTFLDQINESLFKPRGLYCMIMTFKPDNPYDPVLGMDINAHNINSTDAALAKTLSTPDSELGKKLKSIRLTSGVSKGEMSLPEAAPLIYPALDAAVASNKPLPQKQNALTASLQSSSAFVSSYLDRRAQATYSGMHPSSQLAAVAPPPEKKFASRFSDPNHPANSGTILGLLTGGAYDPKAKKRGRKAQRRAAKQGQVLSEEEIRNIEMGHARAPRRRQKSGIVGPIGLVKKVLHKDVLYLTIVNLPSESEMMEMRQELERMKTTSQNQGGWRSPSPRPNPMGR